MWIWRNFRSSGHNEKLQNEQANRTLVEESPEIELRLDKFNADLVTFRGFTAFPYHRAAYGFGVGQTEVDEADAQFKRQVSRQQRHAAGGIHHAGKSFFANRLSAGVFPFDGQAHAGIQSHAAAAVLPVGSAAGIRV